MAPASVGQYERSIRREDFDLSPIKAGADCRTTVLISFLDSHAVQADLRRYELHGPAHGAATAAYRKIGWHLKPMPGWRWHSHFACGFSWPDADGRRGGAPYTPVFAGRISRIARCEASSDENA